MFYGLFLFMNDKIMNDKNKKKELWSGKWAFILAASGSAIGLGNFLKFPYLTSQNGGVPFIFIFLVCVFLIGLPVMIAELSLGKLAPDDMKGSLGADNSKKTSFRYARVLSLLSAIVVLSFYSVIAGYSIEYAIKSTGTDFQVIPEKKLESLLKEKKNMKFAKNEAFEEALNSELPDRNKRKMLLDAFEDDIFRQHNSEVINEIFNREKNKMSGLLKRNGVLELWQNYFLSKKT